MINQLNPKQIDAELDVLALRLYNNNFGNRGSIEQKPQLPNNATSNEIRIYNDAMWYWNTEKITYSINYSDVRGGEQTLYGYFLKNGNSNKTAIVVHGWTGFGAEMGGWAKIYFDLGYNIFTPDLRGHGRSTADAINFGALDSTDLVEWIEVCCDKEPATEEFVLFGISMGALAVLGAAGKLPDNRKTMLSSVFVDSAFDDVQKLLALKFATQPEVQGLSFWDSLIVFGKVDDLFKQNQGVNFSDLLSPANIQKLSLPILIIHGSEDALDTLKVPYKIYLDVITNEKQYLLIEGAGHAECFRKDYDSYKETMVTFLTQRETAPLISGYNLAHYYFVYRQEDIKNINLPVIDAVDGDLSESLVISGVDFSKYGLYKASALATNSRGDVAKKSLWIVYVSETVEKTTVLPYTIGEPYVFVLLPYSKEDLSFISLHIHNDDGTISGRGTNNIDNHLAIFNVSDNFIYAKKLKPEVDIFLKNGDFVNVNVDVMTQV
ncbi:alpha/beta fold hydrolase [Enterobacteriaceae bacterium ML5]|nr:alpha/beta fold hydrolase [Enterobacteriaceae bacterium ML5]